MVVFFTKMHMIVSGRVQGVFFRRYTKTCADELKIKGRVRNLPGGSVEIECEGDENALKLFLEKLKEGPPASRVDDVSVEEKDDLPEFEGFEIAYTN